MTKNRNFIEARSVLDLALLNETISNVRHLNTLIQVHAPDLIDEADSLYGSFSYMRSFLFEFQGITDDATDHQIKLITDYIEELSASSTQNLIHIFDQLLPRVKVV